jgi:hypothetical protein
MGSMHRLETLWRVRVHICEFHIDENESKPGWKGIALGVKWWKSLGLFHIFETTSNDEKTLRNLKLRPSSDGLLRFERGSFQSNEWPAIEVIHWDATKSHSGCLQLHAVPNPAFRPFHWISFLAIRLVRAGKIHSQMWYEMRGSNGLDLERMREFARKPFGSRIERFCSPRLHENAVQFIGNEFSWTGLALHIFSWRNSRRTSPAQRANNRYEAATPSMRMKGTGNELVDRFKGNTASFTRCFLWHKRWRTGCDTHKHLEPKFPHLIISFSIP